MSAIIPVALFAYARPQHLGRTLACLQADQVPLIYAFSDGSRAEAMAPAVADVRRLLREVDWCDLILCERPENLGLGRSIRAGVASVLEKHTAVIVFEDDLTCVPGTYEYLCAALEHYRDEERVMSVAGWTHPSVIPNGVSAKPYFDGRAECWLWGTWARAWPGMEQSAVELMRACEARGLDPLRYGPDLPEMAALELEKNIWAVRWLYLHILHGGLCMRPPQSLVEHIGSGALATNAANDSQWSNPPLQACPALPDPWPEPIENPACPGLWQQAVDKRSSLRRQVWRRLRTVKSLWQGGPR